MPDDSESARADGEQAKIDTYREMNRYDGSGADYPSDKVFAHPRRTLHNGWRKFHAANDCGRGKVAYVERTGTRPPGENYEHMLRCWECGHRVDEEDVLFIGGDWYSQHGWQEYGTPIESVYIPPKRVLDLGPDPDQDELIDALQISRTEQQAGPSAGGPIREEQWNECENCGNPVPMRFDRRCRMCYDGEWTERLQESLNAFENKVREWHNDSHVHLLEKHVDPFSIKGRAFEEKILWRRHDEESVVKLVEVKQCLQDDSDGHWEYILTDVTHTMEWRYHEDDVADCFWDTGLYNSDHPKAVMDDRIREVWERVKIR